MTAQTLIDTTLDGLLVDPTITQSDALVRAVVISLFSWRRANPDDDLPGLERMGWWGDTFPQVENDRIAPYR